jgi:hypothetical protein
MERFTLKIFGNKKLSVDKLFQHEEKGFHPEPEDISRVLDGISIDELVKEYELLGSISVKLIDTHLGLEWELCGFGWKLVSAVQPIH